MRKFEKNEVEVMYNVETLEFQDMKREDIKEPITLTSKSEMFRQMYDAGMDVCDIAKECKSHYSFVYGVISNSRESRPSTKTTASDEIRMLYSQGKTAGEIAKMLNKNYSFVFGVIKKVKDLDPSVPVLSTTGYVVNLPEPELNPETFAKKSEDAPDPDENIAKKQVKADRKKKPDAPVLDDPAEDRKEDEVAE